MPSSADKEQISSAPAASPSPAQSAERVRLSMEVALDLVLCGAFLAGLCGLAQHLQPDFQCATLVTGLVGGGLCVLWGVLGRRGTYCRGGAMATLAAVACVLVRQAVHSWAAAAAGEPKGRLVAALMMVLVAFCVGMLANVAQERRRLRA